VKVQKVENRKNLFLRNRKRKRKRKRKKKEKSLKPKQIRLNRGLEAQP